MNAKLAGGGGGGGQVRGFPDRMRLIQEDESDAQENEIPFVWLRKKHEHKGGVCMRRQGGGGAMERVAGRVCALAFAALLFLFLALAAATQSHAETLVSNLGQADGSANQLTSFDVAHPFTAGGAFVLESVTVRFTAAPSGLTLQVGSGQPHSLTSGG